MTTPTTTAPDTPPDDGPAPDSGSARLREVLARVLDELDGHRLAPQVVTWLHGTELLLVTRPAATFDQATSLFEALGGPPPGLHREPRIDSIRAAGPVPALGLRCLSIVVDL